MKAVRIGRYGGPEVLRLDEVPEPVPLPAEVRVAVRAAGVNRADLLQRRGAYPAPPEAPPDIPGLEFSGVVEAAGEGVREPAVGTRVMGLLGGGGYAEKVVARADMALPIPSGLSFVEAAAVPEAFYTAFDALVLQGGLQPGERVLVHAAGSGVGTAALQVADAFGAGLVIGTASAAKLRAIAARGLRLDAGVDYRSESFRRVVDRLTGGRGMDLVLDLVGAVHWQDNLACVAERGRILLVGLVGGSRAEVDLATLLRKRLHVVGTVLRSRSVAEKLELTAAFRDSVLPLLENGRLRPVVDRSLPLAEAAEAHAYMEANRNVGKIVLEIGAEGSRSRPA
ncbi:MAG: NAD(P)H-quinone oxidoreductase [Gemmatimonadota bacterium]